LIKERKANVARCDIIVIGGGAGGVAANRNIVGWLCH